MLTCLKARAPKVIDIEAATDVLRSVMLQADASRVLAVPLVAGGIFYGVVTTPLEAERPDDLLAERLQGLANQGATRSALRGSSTRSATKRFTTH